MYEEFANKKYIEQEAKFSETYQYLCKYIDVKYKNYNQFKKDVLLNKTIWIMWYQGLDNAPLIVRRCIESVYKYKPEGFEIVLITENNIDDYLDIPNFILEKLENGTMTLTHFSDLVRLYLLVEYGGVWIDSTVFICDTIPEYMMNNMFIFKTASAISDPLIKNSSWWISAKKNNYLLTRTLNIIEEYWKNENELIEYYLLHIVISLVVDKDVRAKAEFLRIPSYSNLNAHFLITIMGDNFSEKQIEIIRDVCPIQKLSYKKRIICGDVHSIYEGILEGLL